MPATREDLLARLNELGIETTTRHHAPVYTVEEARALRGEIPGGHCKNLFLKDDKGNIWLIVCLEEAADRPEGRACPDRLAPAVVREARPSEGGHGRGAGLRHPFRVDQRYGKARQCCAGRAMMAHEFLNYHPLENTATTTIRAADLVAFIRCLRA